MTNTTNLGLKKPGYNDAADIADINDNMDTIDAKMGAVGSTSLQAQIGTTAMGTTATTVKGAIKEHSDKIGSSPMGTTATTLTGAIAELGSDISDVNSNLGSPSSASAVTGVDAFSKINSLNSKIGNLSNLSTTEKSSLVGATNEIDAQRKHMFMQDHSDANVRIYTMRMGWNTEWNAWELVVEFGAGTAHFRVDLKQ